MSEKKYPPIPTALDPFHARRPMVRRSSTAKRVRGGTTTAATARKNKRERSRPRIPYVVILKYVRPEDRPKRTAAAFVVAPYIDARAKRMSGLTASTALQNMYYDAKGALTRYRAGDLKYDFETRRLREVHRFDVHNAAWLSEDTAFVPSLRDEVIAQRKDKHVQTHKRLRSTCATPAYLARHPLSSLHACPEPHKHTCRNLGTGKGSHCVRRFGSEKGYKGTGVVDEGDEDEGDDLSAFLCARLRMP